VITHLEIKGFKSLVDVSIELGAVNVFIGANGSGKSNLLEAVGFLSAIIGLGPETESLRYRGIREGYPSSFCASLKGQEQLQLSLAMEDEEMRYFVKLEPNQSHPTRWHIIEERGSFEDSGSFVRLNDHFTVVGMGGEPPIPLHVNPQLLNRSCARYALTISSISKKNRPKPNLSLTAQEDWRRISSLEEPNLFDQVASMAIFAPGTSQLRGSRTDIQREPLGLGGSGLSQAIDEMLRMEPEKLGPFDLDDVYELIDWADSLSIDEATHNGEATRLRIGDRFMGNGHKTVSLVEASEGALYVLFMLALVGHKESPPIFAVDNFDQALHPRLARALTRLVSEQVVDDGTRQMLATTHNPLVLDGLDLLDDRIRLFTVDRDPTGASQVRRVLVTEELMAKADEGFSLSQLWTTGRLGGVPRAI
jgi:predicted ATPase